MKHTGRKRRPGGTEAVLVLGAALVLAVLGPAAQGEAAEGGEREPEAVCRGGRVLSCDLPCGVRITLGTGDAGDAEGIVLDPSVTVSGASDPEEKYAFRILACGGRLEYGGQAGTGPVFCFQGRTRDTLVSAAREGGEAFGVRWVCGDRRYDPEGRAVLFLHALRLRDGALLGAVRAEIGRDGAFGPFRLLEAGPSDALVRGELAEGERAALVGAAAAFFSSGAGKVQAALTPAALANAAPRITAEKTGRVFHGRLYDLKGHPAPAGRFQGREVLALSIPTEGLGTLTAYFVPRDRASGLPSLPAGDSGFVLAGYDIPDCPPFTRESLAALLPPEDREAFFAVPGAEPAT